MDLVTEIALEIKARTPLLILVTAEEERAVRIVTKVAEHLSWSCLSWSVCRGYRWEANPKTAAMPTPADEPLSLAFRS